MRAIAAGLVLLALWLLTHPWEGLWHDSRLYALQALRRLAPGQFGGDLFFLHGSQDAFTLFSPLFAGAIQAFGLDTAALLLQAVGSLLWVGAAAFLLAAFLRGLPLWLGLVLVVALPADYGPMIAMFQIGEPFPTPRLFAEALGMLAIGSMLRGRWLAALPALLLAVLLHPLMAAGVVLCGLLLQLQQAAGRRRRLLVGLLLAGAAAVLAAAWLGVAPFPRLLLAMDDAWFAPVVSMTPVVTWDGWRLAEWGSRTALAFSLVGLAAALASGTAARWFRCAALAGALGLLAAWAGTGLLHNQLLMQAQPWRALWLLQLATAPALAWLWQAYWRRGRVFRLLLWGLCLAILHRNTLGGALAVLLALLFCWQARRARPTPIAARHYRLLLGLLAVLALALGREIAGGPALTGVFLQDVPLARSDTLWLFIWLKRGAAALLGAGWLLLVWRLAGSAQRGRRLAGVALALLALAASVALALARAEAARYVAPATEAAVRRSFLPLIPPHAVVYWQNDVRHTWFLLRRASYASNPQMAGIVFNRGTALEGQRRMAVLERLGAHDGVRKRNRIETARAAERLPPPSAASLAAACADPALHFVVLGTDLGGAVAQAAGEHGQLYLYDCARLRGGAAPP